MRPAGDEEADAATEAGGDGPEAAGEGDPLPGAHAEARLAVRTS
jgi:hypothetical protein